MATLDQMVDRVRSASRLNRPLPESLPEPDIALAIVEVGDELVTRLNQTAEAWLEGRKRINVSANVGIYVLNADNYSKGRYLFTVDSSDPNHNRKRLELVDREKLTDFYSAGDGGIAATPTGFYKHNSKAAAVYYDSDTSLWRIEFGPVPSQSAEYDFYFEPLTERPQSKDSIAFRFPNFDFYVADKVAMRLVKACQWTDLSEEQNRARRDEIRNDLAPAIQSGDALFRQWRQTMYNRSSGQVIPFGYSRW